MDSDVNFEIRLEQPYNFKFTKEHKQIIINQVCDRLFKFFNFMECPEIEIVPGSIKVIMKNIDISKQDLTKNQIKNKLTYIPISFDNNQLSVLNTNVYTNITEDDPIIYVLKDKLKKIKSSITVNKYNKYNNYKSYNAGFKESIETDFYSIEDIGTPIIENQKTLNFQENFNRKINKKIYENIMFQPK